VLTGLDQRPAPKEIAEALLDENINVLEIYCMRGTNRPAYLVVTDKNYTLDTLENTKFLLSTRVRWERHINNQIFVQCHRCQRWGDATANCHSRAKYVKCAGDHLARDQGCEVRHILGFSKCRKCKICRQCNLFL
jgi:hypothetical protein